MDILWEFCEAVTDGETFTWVERILKSSSIWFHQIHFTHMKRLQNIFSLLTFQSSLTCNILSENFDTESKPAK